MADRIPEVDIARGCAIVLMIISNFVTDLQYFFNYSGHETFWYWFARVTAFMFIFLAGISLVLSNKRSEYEKKDNFIKYLKRGLFIFSFGMLITIATFIFIPNDYVRFGVLHLIGLSVILSYFFLKLKNNHLNLVFGIIFVLFGFLFQKITFNSDLFFIFGIISKTFSSVDYFPLFPWFGVVLLGIFAGRVLYKEHKPIFNFKENTFARLFSFMGRNSLMIYLVHQPILLTLLFLLS